jgi:hypothetical protein
MKLPINEPAINDPAVNEPGIDLATLRAVIARSPILVSQVAAIGMPPRGLRLPLGFDAKDIAVLDWVAGERRRASRSLARMWSRFGH